MEKRPTDLKVVFLLKVLSRRGGTMRFIRWSFFNPLGNFFEYKAVPFAGLQFSACLKNWRSLLQVQALQKNKKFSQRIETTQRMKILTSVALFLSAGYFLLIVACSRCVFLV